MEMMANDERFETLVREHGTQMLAVARRILRGDEEEARDAVQDALVAVVRSFDRFRAEAQVSTWLFRIVTNAALMRLRSGRRRRTTAIEDLHVAVEDSLRQPSSGTGSAHEVLETKRTRQAVRDGIDRLPAHHRRIIELRDIEERSTAETAEILGISPCAAKLRLLRARRALRALLLLSASVSAEDAPQPRRSVAADHRAACA